MPSSCWLWHRARVGGGQYLGAFVVESAVAADRGGLGWTAPGPGSAPVRRPSFWHLAARLNSGRLRLVAGCSGRTVGFVLLRGLAPSWCSGSHRLAAGWGWPGLFNFAVVKSSPGGPPLRPALPRPRSIGALRRVTRLRLLVMRPFRDGLVDLRSGPVLARSYPRRTRQRLRDRKRRSETPRIRIVPLADRAHQNGFYRLRHQPHPFLVSA